MGWGLGPPLCAVCLRVAGGGTPGTPCGPPPAPAPACSSLGRRGHRGAWVLETCLVGAWVPSWLSEGRGGAWGGRGPHSRRGERDWAAGSFSPRRWQHRPPRAGPCRVPSSRYLGEEAAGCYFPFPLWLLQARPPGGGWRVAEWESPRGPRRPQRGSEDSLLHWLWPLSFGGFSGGVSPATSFSFPIFGGRVSVS